MTIPTKQEANKLYPDSFWEYKNGDYEFETQDGYWHLIRNKIDLLADKQAIDCFSYYNGDVEFKTKNGWFPIKAEEIEEIIN